jgi:type I restriction enzyme M protein
MIDRVHRDLAEDDAARIAGTYHAWRGDKGAGTYEDIAGFCKTAKLEEIRQHGHILTPGRYVGAEDEEEDDEPFEEKLRRLSSKLEEQFAEGARIQHVIRESLAKLTVSR